MQRRRGTIRVRAARKSDREPILEFCRDTFSWGDYIERVWERWLADKRRGQPLVAEEEQSKRRIAMSHVAVCPGGRSAWLEGVRVYPDFRRSGVASILIKSMLAYAGRRGVGDKASAIVAHDNVASQRMMEKNGFEAISRWAYYSIDGKKIKLLAGGKKGGSPENCV